MISQHSPNYHYILSSISEHHVCRPNDKIILWTPLLLIHPGSVQLATVFESDLDNHNFCYITITCMHIMIPQVHNGKFSQLKPNFIELSVVWGNKKSHLWMCCFIFTQSQYSSDRLYWRVEVSTFSQSCSSVVRSLTCSDTSYNRFR